MSAEAQVARGPRFYFALPRLVEKLRGGSAARAESSGCEATVIGLLVFLVSDFAVLETFAGSARGLTATAFVILLAFALWIVWALLLFLNSLIIGLVRKTGWLKTVPNRYAQSILIAILTTAFAYRLITAGAVTRYLGWLWMTVLAANGVAAGLLWLIHATSRKA